MTNLTYETIFNPSAEIVSPIQHGLHAFDLAHLGPEVINNHHHVAILARDEKSEVIGGIHGEIFYNWLHIDTFWVDETYRGQGIGARLLAQLEEIALTKGCHGSHLETIDFQALGFYLKNGYAIFGQLENKPIGSTWYYLKKKL